MSDSDLSDVEWPEMPVDPIENDVTATTSAVDADDETAPPKNKLKLKRKRLKTIDASEIGKCRNCFLCAWPE